MLVRKLEARCWKLDDGTLLDGQIYPSLKLLASSLHTSFYNYIPASSIYCY
jgi:hypothetical protein